MKGGCLLVFEKAQCYPKKHGNALSNRFSSLDNPWIMTVRIILASRAET
jgi:hypothetical protein